MGTIGYASPEQIRGRAVDRRTDIFAFGALLFEMLTGGPPFPGETAADGVGKTLHKEPEWESLPAGLPPRLILLLRRCLAKDLGDRLCDMGDARLELAQLRDHADLDLTDVPTSGRGIIWPSLAVASLLFGLTFAGLYFMGPGFDSTAESMSNETPRPVNRSITVEDPYVLEAFMALNDSERLFFTLSETTTEEEGGSTSTVERHLCVREPDSAEPRIIHTLRGNPGYDVSPDGTAYALNYAGRILIGQVDSEIDPVELTRIPNPTNTSGPDVIHPGLKGIVWFDSDTLVLESIGEKGEHQLVVVNARTGEVDRTLPFILDGPLPIHAGFLRAFDDEHVLTYQFIYDEGFRVNLALLSVETGEMRQLVENAGQAVLAADRRTLFFSRGDTIYAAAFDPETNRVLDAGIPVRDDLHSKYSLHGDFDMTGSGDLIYFPGGVQNAEQTIVVDRGEGTRSIGLPAAPYDSTMSVSGDGTRICTTRSRIDGVWEIWGGTLDPPRLSRLRSSRNSDDCYPILSYDGQQLLSSNVTTTPDGVQLSIMFGPVDGSSKARRIWDDQREINVSFTSIRPDNARIAGFTPDPDSVDGAAKLVELDLVTGELNDLLTRIGGAVAPLYSPDGALVAFLTFETGAPEIQVLDLSTGRVTLVSTLPAANFRWVDSPGLGRQIMFWDSNGAIHLVKVADAPDGGLLIGEPEKVARSVPRGRPFATDLSGAFYFFQAGEGDGPPAHLVVIEDWSDSVAAGIEGR